MNSVNLLNKVSDFRDISIKEKYYVKKRKTKTSDLIFDWFMELKHYWTSNTDRFVTGVFQK